MGQTPPSSIREFREIRTHINIHQSSVQSVQSVGQTTTSASVKSPSKVNMQNRGSYWYVEVTLLRKLLKPALAGMCKICELVTFLYERLHFLFEKFAFIKYNS